MIRSLGQPSTVGIGIAELPGPLGGITVRCGFAEYLPEQVLSRVTGAVHLQYNFLDNTPATRFLPFPVASSLDPLPNAVPALKFWTRGELKAWGVME